MNKAKMEVLGLVQGFTAVNNVENIQISRAKYFGSKNIQSERAYILK